ncbi:MAG: shikimate kinase [Chloroflexi bacterium]|nr:shikimate kinase [Chloroflexota bacterium]
MRTNIFLTGFSTTGKSSVGPRLATLLNYDFRDTDKLIQQQSGRTVEDIFRDSGEPTFRDLENAVLRQVCGGTRQVVATGGGIVIRPENRELMHLHGWIICLEARPDTILARLLASRPHTPRPLLASSDPLARIVELKASRAGAYTDADLVIATDDLSPAKVVEAIVSSLTHLAPGQWQGDFPPSGQDRNGVDG